jgi:hypothetical protein
VDSWASFAQPTENDLDYRRFYYQMHQNADREVVKVLDALGDPESSFHRSTIVIFTSDHGELLGAHGGMHQKWHQAYEETVHVPFIVHAPGLFDGRVKVDVLTSHADLLPTMLGLAGVDVPAVQAILETTHDEVHPLVGRDLSGLILGETDPSTVDGPVFFMTDDEPSKGADQIAWNGLMYESVAQPNHVETVVAKLPTGQGGAMEKWKYSRYFDNPQFWSNPGGALPRDVVTQIQGVVGIPGPKVAHTTVKVTPVPDEIEVYNVTDDPMELRNLATSGDPGVQATVAQLQQLLDAEREAKRLQPSSGEVPGQPDP